MPRLDCIPAEQFIRVWQSSACVDDVATKLGLRYYVVHQRAQRMRRRGIPLRHLRKTRGNLDLVQLAVDCATAYRTMAVMADMQDEAEELGSLDMQFRGRDQDMPERRRRRA